MKEMNIILGLASDFRGEELVSHLRELGIEPLVFYGFDYRNSNCEVLDYSLKERTRTRVWLGRDITSGEIGCAKSHESIWRRFLDSEAEWLFVYEEDAVIGDNYLEMHEIIGKSSAKEATVVSFYWPYAITTSVETFSFSSRKVDFIRNKSKSIFKVFVPTYSTVHYAINRKAVEEYFCTKSKIWTTADWPTPFYLMNFYVVKGDVINHNGDISNIESQRLVNQNREPVDLIESNRYSISSRMVSILSRIKKLDKELRQGYNFSERMRILIRFLVYHLYYLQVLPKSIFPVHSGKRESLDQLNKLQISQRLIGLINRRVDQARIHVHNFIVRNLLLLSVVFHESVHQLKRFVFELFGDVGAPINDFAHYLPVPLLPEILSSDQVKLSGASTVVREQFECTCLIPIHNQTPEQLFRAFESVFTQTRSFREVIAIDDGSTDNDCLVAIGKLRNNYPDIKWHAQNNLGVCETRNRLFEFSNTEWVLFFDPDDILAPDACERAQETLCIFPFSEVMYGNVKVIDTLSGHASEWIVKPVSNKIFLSNQLGNTSFIKSEVFRKVGKFDSDFEKLGSEDWDLWQRVYLSGGRFTRIPATVYTYFKNGDQSRDMKFRDQFQMAVTLMRKKRQKEIKLLHQQISST